MLYGFGLRCDWVYSFKPSHDTISRWQSAKAAVALRAEGNRKLCEQKIFIVLGKLPSDSIEPEGGRRAAQSWRLMDDKMSGIRWMQSQWMSSLGSRSIKCKFFRRISKGFGSIKFSIEATNRWLCCEQQARSATPSKPSFYFSIYGDKFIKHFPCTSQIDSHCWLVSWPGRKASDWWSLFELKRVELSFDDINLNFPCARFRVYLVEAAFVNKANRTVNSWGVWLSSCIPSCGLWCCEKIAKNM